MEYKFVDDLTSDVMFEAYGRDLKELFINAAKALSTIICKVEKIDAKEKVDVEVKGEDKEDLLFNWLQEIIAAVDIEEKFFSKFEIKQIDDTHLKAELYGEPITPEKGETVVKSLTYYKFKLEETEHGYKVTVVVDI